MIAALALAAALFTPPPATGATVMLSASVSGSELTLDSSLTVAGSLSESGAPVAAAPLALQADPYPFDGFATIAHGSTAGDGSFSFTDVKLDRNTRLRVVREGSSPTSTVSSTEIAVTVNPNVTINAASLGPGRTRLSIRIEHTVHGGSSAPVDVSWFAAAKGTRVFHLLALTPTRELSSGVSYASAIIDPPGRQFAYRVCLNPAWERAMGPASRHGRCPRGDYTVHRNVG